MIKTTFFLAMTDVGHTMLSKTILMPFLVVQGYEMDINGEGWRSIVADVRFNMVTLAQEINLTDYACSDIADREETKSELIDLGWSLDYASA